MSAASRLVLRWAEYYTRGLPAPVAADRRDELASDLHEQLADGQRMTSLSIVGRWLLGIPSDLSWRARQRGAARRSGTLLRSPGERLVTLSLVLGVLLLAWSTVALVRVWTNVGTFANPDFNRQIVGVIAMTAIGLALFARARTRTWGAAMLSIGAIGVVWPIMRAGSQISAIWMDRLIRHLFWTTPAAVSFALVLLPGAAATVVFVAAAVRSHRAPAPNLESS